ncbi:MAG: hypothetical protein ACLUR5_01250 [Eubacterium ventriosum]
MTQESNLAGTIVFVVIVVFQINTIAGYGLFTIFMATVIKMSKIPFMKTVEGVRGIIFITAFKCSFKYFL